MSKRTFYSFTLGELERPHLTSPARPAMYVFTTQEVTD